MNNGQPFIVLEIETGDCKRFNNTFELRKECNVSSKYGARLMDVLNHPEVIKKYKFFAYESDLLKYYI